MIYQHQLNGCSPKQERCCNWWASPHWSPKAYNLVFWLLSVNIKLFHETTVITDFVLVTSLLNTPMPPPSGVHGVPTDLRYDIMNNFTVESHLSKLGHLNSWVSLMCYKKPNPLTICQPAVGSSVKVVGIECFRDHCTHCIHSGWKHRTTHWQGKLHDEGIKRNYWYCSELLDTECRNWVPAYNPAYSSTLHVCSV